MAFSNIFNYLKPGNSSASGNLNTPDKDAAYKVGGTSKKPKRVGKNKKKHDPDLWQIIEEDDDEVKVPIKKKLQKTEPESLHSSILLVDSSQTDQDADGFYMFEDIVDTKNDSLLKKLDDIEKHTYSIIKYKGNRVRVIQTDDPHAWENSDDSDDSDDSFKVIDFNDQVDDKQLLPMVESLKILDHAQLPLHLQPFYEPDKPKKPLLLHSNDCDSDSSSSIEVIEDPWSLKFN